MDIGRTVMSVVMAIVMFMGGGAFVNGIRLLAVGAPNRAGAIVATLMGALLIGVAVAYYYLAFFARPAAAARVQQVRMRYPGQPWMEREDWASRRLKSSARGPALFLWIWTIGWWFFLGLIGTVNRDKILAAMSESWWNVALLAVFVGAGLIGAALAVSFSLNVWRYGVSTLYLDTLPAFMGEKFIGTLTARLRPKPRNDLVVELRCEEVEWVTSGYGKDRNSRVVVTPLGAVSGKIEAARLMPTNEGVKAQIAVDVPTGLPVSSRDARGNGIRWSIRVSTTGDDAPFSCEFEIPVFERDAPGR